MAGMLYKVIVFVIQKIAVYLLIKWLIFCFYGMSGFRENNRYLYSCENVQRHIFTKLSHPYVKLD